MLSAGFGGVTVATITNPIWVVKTRMQLQTNNQYKNSLDCFSKIWHGEGIRGLYKGLTASYVGMSETSIQFVIYEYLKKRELTKIKRKTKNEYESLDKTSVFVIASISKLLASAITYPHEVIRTRLREASAVGSERKYKGVFQGLVLVYKEEGIRGLYGGMGAHMIRVVPNAAIMFVTVEAITGYLGRLAGVWIKV